MSYSVIIILMRFIAKRIRITILVVDGPRAHAGITPALRHPSFSVLLLAQDGLSILMFGFEKLLSQAATERVLYLHPRHFQFRVTGRGSDVLAAALDM